MNHQHPAILYYLGNNSKKNVCSCSAHIFFPNVLIHWVPVAQVYNPSYSGDRDQEDRGSKPVWANSSMRPYFEIIIHKKRADGMVQEVGPEFKPQYCWKKKKSLDPQFSEFMDITPRDTEGQLCR
jgi:hypothetical protein